MDNMRIPGTEPLSVILIQTKWLNKFKIDAPKVPIEAEAKNGWCDKPILKITISVKFKNRKFLCSQNATKQNSRRRTWLRVPSGIQLFKYGPYAYFGYWTFISDS